MALGTYGTMVFELPTSTIIGLGVGVQTLFECDGCSSGLRTTPVVLKTPLRDKHRHVVYHPLLHVLLS
jgi:hypothetical protein